MRRGELFFYVFGFGILLIIVVYVFIGCYRCVNFIKIKFLNSRIFIICCYVMGNSLVGVLYYISYFMVVYLKELREFENVLCFFILIKR